MIFAFITNIRVCQKKKYQREYNIFCYTSFNINIYFFKRNLTQIFSLKSIKLDEIVVNNV